MTGSPTHVTIATSTGPLWLALVAHFGTGLVGLVTGFAALAVPKGGRIHRQSGVIFVYAMIMAMALATGIGIYEGKHTALGTPFAAYLVFTGLTTVRPLPGGNRVAIALMWIPLGTAVVYGLTFWSLPSATSVVDGAPGPMLLFLGTLALLAFIGDLRMVLAGGIDGARRIARHLWRMCFSLFVASGSFFFGQMKFLPKPLRIMPIVAIPALAPLVILLYWMWRVRVRRTVRGLITRPVAAQSS